MDTKVLIADVLKLIPALIVLYRALRAARRRNYQFGLFELMLLPVLLMPATFFAIAKDIMVGILAGIYTLSFSLLSLGDENRDAQRPQDMVYLAVFGLGIFWLWSVIVNYLVFGPV